MNYVAAFRTYSWDEDVATLARRFFAACPTARQVVLADETNGTLDIRGYEKISHTKDTSAYGLLTYPSGNSLWHNVDYGLYILRATLPGYDYYVSAESDLAVNADVEHIVTIAAQRQIDLIAHWLGRAGPAWMWYEAARTIFEHVHNSVLFFMVVSARAVDLLYHVRQQLTLSYQAGTITSWPFCEAFVPSVLNAAGMSLAEVGQFVDTTHLRVRPRLLLTDPRANQPNSLAHSVLGKPTFIRAVLKENPPGDWFSPESWMRQTLDALPLWDYAGPLRRAFATAGDQPGLSRFDAHLTQTGTPLVYTRP